MGGVKLGVIEKIEGDEVWARTPAGWALLEGGNFEHPSWNVISKTKKKSYVVGNVNVSPERKEEEQVQETSELSDSEPEDENSNIKCTNQSTRSSVAGKSSEPEKPKEIHYKSEQ